MMRGCFADLRVTFSSNLFDEAEKSVRKARVVRINFENQFVVFKMYSETPLSDRFGTC